MNGANDDIFKTEGAFFCRVKCAWQKNGRSGWTLEILDEDMRALGVQFLAAPAGSRWLDELTSAVGRLWADDYATQTAVLGGDMRAAVGLTGAVRITRKGQWFNCTPICPAKLEASMTATAAADDDEASAASASRAATAPATEPATAPADEPATTPATTTRQAWATIREWAAGHPGWRHVTSVDADGRGVTIDWADVQWPSRADDRGWMTIDADGNVAVGGKNGGCIRATRGYEPPADVVAAARAIMAARQRQEAMSVIDTSDAAAWDCRADGDDYELISAHMREARRGRRAYDRW